MIISASRRTDIPAFYAEWFMNRIRAGYCVVPNPFNAKQVSRVPLDTGEVDVVVFWTRDPRPLLSRLKEFDNRGYRYYFLYTVLNNGIEQPTPIGSRISISGDLAEILPQFGRPNRTGEGHLAV
jgi:hypothetical protein